MRKKLKPHCQPAAVGPCHINPRPCKAVRTSCSRMSSSSCPYKSFTRDLAGALKDLASAMTKVADAMEICHSQVAGGNISFAATLPTSLLPPPIDTATPAARKAADAMAADAMSDDAIVAADALATENALLKLHNEYLAAADFHKGREYLNKCWDGGWITVGGKAYQIYRYHLYHYNKKDHCITHYGHFHPYSHFVQPDYLVPDFKDAPKGYSARSALYA